MKLGIAVLALLFVAGSAAGDPVYLDQLMETPVAALREQFPGLRREGCYRIAADRFVLIDIDKKDDKPWRIVLTATAPCRRPEDVPVALDIRQRKGVSIGMKTVEVVEVMGRPDTSAAPEPALKKLGDTEYFFVCRVSEGCARHTSIFVREGEVSAIAEWYSE